jgi:hypothetical protein
MLAEKLGESPIQVTPLSPIIPATDWGTKPIPEAQWIVQSLIPSRCVTLLTGQGGAGKSFLTLTLLAACAQGEQWLGHQTEHCYAMGFYCEDERDILHRRVADLMQVCNADMTHLTDMELHERTGADSAMASFNRYDSSMSVMPFYDQVRDRVLATGARLLVLDNLYDIFDGNENERVQARRFIRLLTGLAKEMDGAVVICAHPSKSALTSGDGYSGSTAWRDSVRSLLYLTFAKGEDGVEDRSRLQLVVKKLNHASEGGVYDLKRIHGVPVYEPPLGLEQGVTGAMIRRNVRRAFLEGVMMAEQKGLDLGVNVGPNYAPAKMLSLSPCRGFTKQQLHQAMYYLIEHDFVKNDEVLDQKRRPRHYLRLTEKGRKGYDPAIYD